MFLGFTRFSLFQPGAPHWVATRRLTPAEYRARLFNPSRLDERAEIFFGISLPQLEIAAQGHQVKHVVSYSDVLPSKYKELLYEAAEKYDFLILDECVGDQQPMTSAEVLKLDTRTRGGFRFAEYRLDDDDVLSASYFDRLGKYLLPQFEGMFVSFGVGLTALFIDGELYYARRSLQRLIAIGLAQICKVDSEGSITKPPPIRHSRSDMAAPVILDSRELTYIWMRHGEQDSFTDLHSSDALNEAHDKIRQRMSKFPAADDHSEIAEHFPVVANRVHLTEGPGVISETLIDESLSIPQAGLSASFEPLTGRTNLSVHLRTRKTEVHRNILVSFDLVDAKGEPAPRESWERELKKIGVRFSPDRKVGYYRYFDTQDGVTVGEMRLDWPEGLFLRGIKFLKYRDPQAEVRIDKATISADF